MAFAITLLVHSAEIRGHLKLTTKNLIQKFARFAASMVSDARQNALQNYSSIHCTDKKVTQRMHLYQENVGITEILQDSRKAALKNHPCNA